MAKNQIPWSSRTPGRGLLRAVFYRRQGKVCGAARSFRRGPNPKGGYLTWKRPCTTPERAETRFRRASARGGGSCGNGLRPARLRTTRSRGAGRRRPRCAGSGRNAARGAGARRRRRCRGDLDFDIDDVRGIGSGGDKIGRPAGARADAEADVFARMPGAEGGEPGFGHPGRGGDLPSSRRTPADRRRRVSWLLKYNILPAARRPRFRRGSVRHRARGEGCWRVYPYNHTLERSEAFVGHPAFAALKRARPRLLRVPCQPCPEVARRPWGAAPFEITAPVSRP